MQKALVFVSRCQNLESEHNTTPFAATAGKGNADASAYAAADGIERDLNNRGQRSLALFGGSEKLSRAEFIRRLSTFDGEQLVIVRYPYPAWRVGEEWVYNSANIDAQRIVFAHDLGIEQNRALLDYYPRRRVWLMTFDDLKIHFSPYSNLP